MEIEEYMRILIAQLYGKRYSLCSEEMKVCDNQWDEHFIISFSDKKISMHVTFKEEE